MVNFINLFYHYKGRFERNAAGVFEYVGGEVNEFPNVNVARVKKTLLEGLFKSLGYIAFSDFYWAEDELAHGLKLIRFDSDVVRMLNHARRSGVVHVYWEHVVDAPVEVEVVDVVDENPQQATTHPQQQPQVTPKRRIKMRARRTPTRNKTTASRNINQAQEEATPKPEPIIHPSPEAVAAEIVVDVPVATNSQTGSASGHGAAAPTEILTQQSNNIKKSRRASYKRPPPTGQKFVHGKRGEAPKIFVPRVSPDATDSDDDSDADPDYHQYESEDLHSPLSSDCDDECHSEDEVWPQSNPEARFGLVHLELGMEFATMKEFQRAVRIFGTQPNFHAKTNK
ncbi:hypothetical protein PIB30_066024 [Stylosanthes scabra]|uniref:PB1-like domain-containing protein n=1 Tax=Stylosanthes scabra TaxID=79078 RepID=A0ABU6ZKX9_9FABA|nr:hypothetical protein [Stylosanthes scabra]